MHSDSDSGSRLNHTYLPPIVTTPLANVSLDEAFEDWTVLSRSSHSMDRHIYSLHASSESIRSVVCFRASKFSDTSYKLLYRTYHHLLQHPLAMNTVCYTQPSICWRMIYSWKYSTAANLILRMVGMINLGGANSLMFVEDGVTSSTLRHPTWVRTLCARIAPPMWTHWTTYPLYRSLSIAWREFSPSGGMDSTRRLGLNVVN